MTHLSEASTISTGVTGLASENSEKLTHQITAVKRMNEKKLGANYVAIIITA